MTRSPVKSLVFCLLAALPTIMPSKAAAFVQSPQSPLPTSRKAPPTHEALLKRAAEEPILTEQLLSSEDKPLTDEQQKDIDRSNELFRQSTESRKSGNFKAAAEQAELCAALREAVLGQEHHLTVTAGVAAQTMQEYAEADASVGKKLVDADRACAEAEDLIEKGRYSEARSAVNRAIEIREGILGKKHVELGDALRIRAVSEYELKDLSAAEDSIARSLEIIEQTYGKIHPMAANVLDRQGWVYINKGDPQKAVESLQSAVRIFRMTVGETAATAEALDNLGTALTLRGDVEEGLQRKLRSLVIRKAVLGETARDTGVSYSNLAWLYGQIGRPNDVLPMRRLALETLEKGVGPDHPYSKLEAQNAASALAQAGKTDEAIKLYEKYRALDDKPGALLDAGAIARCTALAVLYFDANREKDARSLLEKAQSDARKLHETADRAALVELMKVANAYRARRMYDDATPVYEQVWSWSLQLPEEDGASLIQHGEDLGLMYLEVGRNEDAHKVLERVVDSARKKYGESDRRLCTPMLSLGLALEKLGKFDEAIGLYEQVLQISEKQIGSRSLAVGYVLHSIGRAFARQKRFDQAKFNLEEALAVLEPFKDRDPQEMIYVQLDLGDYYAASGDAARALTMMDEALKSCRDIQARNRSVHADALLALALHSRLKLTGADLKDRDAARQELKSALTRLQDAHAMTAEERRWQKELN